MEQLDQNDVAIMVEDAAGSGNLLALKVLFLSKRSHTLNLPTPGFESEISMKTDALCHASASGRYNVVDFLIKEGGADIEAAGRSVRSCPEASRKIPFGKRIVHQPTECTPLYYAAQYCAEETVELLISHGADVNSQANTNRETALHGVIENRCKDQCNDFIVAMLLDNGANWQLQSERRQISPVLQLVAANEGIGNMSSILHLAAANGRTEVVKLLLSRGANIEEELDGELGHTPLIISSEVLEPETTRTLLEAGANVFAKKLNDKDVLCNALFQASMDTGWRKERAIKTLNVLVQYGADINANVQGQPIFSISLTWNESHLVDWLLGAGAGADVDRPLLLNYWMEIKGFGLATTFSGKDMVEVLVRHGADPKRRNARGRTPLTEFFRFFRGCDEDLDTIRAILESGADVDKPDELDGLSPFRIISQSDIRMKDKVACLKLLQQYSSHKTGNLIASRIRTLEKLLRSNGFAHWMKTDPVTHA